MNIFRWFRNYVAVRPKRVLPVERPPLVFKSRHGETFPIEQSPPHAIDRMHRLDPWHQRIFEPTHVHVATGKQYMLTSCGERIEVTGSDGYPLAEYEDAEGHQYAQWSERFLDGRFRELSL